MRHIIEKPAPGGGTQTSTWRQAAWFIALYAAGLVVTFLVAWFFRTLLGLI